MNKNQSQNKEEWAEERIDKLHDKMHKDNPEIKCIVSHQSQSIREELDITLETLFNEAVSLCLKQIKGEITEEMRIRTMEALNNAGKMAIKQTISQILQEKAEEIANITVDLCENSQEFKSKAISILQKDE